MGLTDIFSSHNHENLHMGDILGVWDIARNKIIGMATLKIFYNQANDKELKNAIKDGVNLIALPHIDKIQKLLKEAGVDAPYEPNLKNKLDDVPDSIKPNSLIQDDEIAASLRELIRLSLSLETEALRNATRADVRNLVTNIFEDDNKALERIIKLTKDKNWLNTPPEYH